jgi:transcription termination factor NusB
MKLKFIKKLKNEIKKEFKDLEGLLSKQLEKLKWKKLLLLEKKFELFE